MNKTRFTLQFSNQFLPLRLLPSLFIWSVISLTSSAALAQSSTSLDDLLAMSFEDVIDYEVVAPTKSGMPLSRVPSAASVLTYQDIQRSSAQTIPELLRLIPGVNVRWNPMVQTIDVRGFGSNPFTSKVLLLIDGVPYNSWNKGGFPQHPGFDFFNINNVKHIEIVRGPGSALYGENALNGVINIVTFSGEEFDSVRAKLQSGNHHVQSLSLLGGSRVGDAGSIFASLRVTEGQLPLELWEQSGARSRGFDLFMKGKYDDFQLAYYRRQDKFDGYVEEANSPPFPPGSVFQSTPDIDQAVNILSGQYNTQSFDENWTVQANLSYSNRDGSHCAACHTGNDSDHLKKSEDHGYQLFGNVQVGLHHFDGHEIVAGIESRKISAGHHAHEFSAALHEEGHGEDSGHHETSDHSSEEEVTEYRKHALFIQDTWKISDRWELIAGLRYDSQTSPTLFDAEVFPRLAVVNRFSDKTTLRLNVSEAARYPSFTELNQSTGFLAVETPDTLIPLATFVPNPQLKPEYVRSLELGLSHQLNESVHLAVDAYQKEVMSPIVIAYPDFRFENHPSDAVVKGVEFSLKSAPSESLSMFFNASYQHNEATNDSLDSGGNPLEFTYSPEYKVNAGLSYLFSPSLSLSLEAKWVDEYEAPAFWYPITLGETQVRPLDDYFYLDLKIDYKPVLSFGNKKRPLTLSFIGKNLADETPYETLTGLGGRRLGREYQLSVSYDWSL